MDQSAPYYRHDGYWNGAVWMPHQWFLWKTMLDLGQADFAFKIAQTALDLWKSEVDESYECFEHFLIESGPRRRLASVQLAVVAGPGMVLGLLPPGPPHDRLRHLGPPLHLRPRQRGCDR